ncbi:hypothetical protein NDU88_005647 [Pleurodeles waltl]|uniref:Uncharacterized protein n=1 Tax=Pleurodeles waltl TaxID=8319 RepID=A0AAV7LQ50_PLEWA|nr:hypothetical protein NDU88_005647 [Pleurodeles waltl]
MDLGCPAAAPPPVLWRARGERRAAGALVGARGRPRRPKRADGERGIDDLRIDDLRNGPNPVIRVTEGHHSTGAPGWPGTGRCRPGAFPTELETRPPEPEDGDDLLGESRAKERLPTSRGHGLKSQHGRRVLVELRYAARLSCLIQLQSGERGTGRDAAGALWSEKINITASLLVGTSGRLRDTMAVVRPPGQNGAQRSGLRSREPATALRQYC